MSDYEAHRGKLFLIKREENEDDKQFIQRIFKDEFNEETWQNDIQDFIYEADLYEQYFYVDGKLYKNVDHQELDPYDAQELNGDEENGYNYFMSFYNGGTCLSEMIEDALKRKNKEDGDPI